MKVISIRQPWAWLIVSGLKDIENRTWPTRYRGEIAIHAGKRVPSQSEVDEIEKKFRVKLPSDFQVGGIIGFADLTDCVTQHPSKWFVGSFGFVLANARACDFIPLRGQLGIFELREAATNLTA